MSHTNFKRNKRSWLLLAKILQASDVIYLLNLDTEKLHVSGINLDSRGFP